MNARTIFRCLGAATIVLLMESGLDAGSASAAEAGLQIRTGLHKDFTRLVLETPEPVPYKFAFPDADEIVVTVTGAVQPDRKAPPAQGIIQHLVVTAGEHGSRLIIKTKTRVDIRRQFTILPKNGKGARIVIDLAASATEARPADSPEPAPRIDLPAPHTTITGEAAPAPAPLPKQAAAVSKRPFPTRPTEPFEVAGTGQLSMLFDRTTPAEQSTPLELAQAGGISVHDWLRQEGTNPNVRSQQPAPQVSPSQPPAPPAYPARPVYRAPASPATATSVPGRGTPTEPAPASTTSSNGTHQYRPYQPYRPYPYLPQATQTTPQTHPSHPGYRNPRPSSAPTIRRSFPTSEETVPASRASTQPADDNSPAARYASQKQTFPAEAQTVDQPRRFYAGFGLGGSMGSYESPNMNTALEKNGLAWNLTGGYRMAQHLAFEAAIGQVGTLEETFPSGSIVTDDYYAFEFNGLVSLPVSPRWSVFGKAGLNLWWVNADTTRQSGTGTEDEDSGVGLNASLGVDFRLMKQIDLRGQWGLYLLTDEVIINTFTASVLYRF